MGSAMRHACLAGTVVALLAGCGDSSATTGQTPPTPWVVTGFPPLPDVALNVPDARIELGNFLFYDTLLSADRETACATCHSEFWGMSDALPLAVGNGAGPLAGPGREGPNTLRRNSPALFNLAFRETLFWDGRTESLEEQALMPLLAADEPAPASSARRPMVDGLPPASAVEATLAASMAIGRNRAKRTQGGGRRCSTPKFIDFGTARARAAVFNGGRRARGRRAARAVVLR